MDMLLAKAWYFFYFGGEFALCWTPHLPCHGAEQQPTRTQLLPSFTCCFCCEVAAGMVCVWPYLNLLYRANGLDDAQIGILAGRGCC